MISARETGLDMGTNSGPPACRRLPPLILHGSPGSENRATHRGGIAQIGRFWSADVKGGPGSLEEKREIRGHPPKPAGCLSCFPVLTLGAFSSLKYSSDTGEALMRVGLAALDPPYQLLWD
jgi:hypothetical protein